MDRIHDKFLLNIMKWMASISLRRCHAHGGQLQLHRNEGIRKASSCVMGVAHECGTKNPNAGLRQSFVLATVSVTVSLGAKPAQAEGECSIVHRLDTVALLHACFPCSDMSDSLDHSPNAFAFAQGVPENRVAFDTHSLSLALSLFLPLLLPL